jgi:hypothetical protein
MAPSSADLIALLTLFGSGGRLRRDRSVLQETERDQRQRDYAGLVSCTRATVVLLAVPITTHEASHPASAELDRRGSPNPWGGGPVATTRCRGCLRFAFYGRVSTEDWQDPVMSRARQLQQAVMRAAG